MVIVTDFVTLNSTTRWHGLYAYVLRRCLSLPVLADARLCVD